MTCNQWPLNMWPLFMWEPGEWPECTIIGAFFGCDIPIDINLECLLNLNVDLVTVADYNTELEGEALVGPNNFYSLTSFTTNLSQSISIITSLIQTVIFDTILNMDSIHIIDLENIDEEESEDSAIGVTTSLESISTLIEIDFHNFAEYTGTYQSVYNIEVDLCESEGCECLVLN